MSIDIESSETRATAATPLRLLSQLSDADLLDAWTRDRSREALAAIVDRYAVMVLSVCRRRCRTAADADDAFQTTFLYLARSSAKIRHPSLLPGWLHRVAQRSAVATLRPKERTTEPMVDTPADPDDPLDRLAQRHEAIVLDEELSNLPEHYRTAIVLHLLEGCPYQTLAEKYGTTIGAVRGYVQRGKKLLAARLRRRGVVPVMAFAAAGAWTVSSAQAAQAGSFLTGSGSATSLPEPPIDPPLLDSLLSSGARLMPSLYLTGGLIGGTALFALILVGGTPNHGQANDSDAVVQVAGAVADQSPPAQSVTTGDAAPAGHDDQGSGGEGDAGSGTPSGAESGMAGYGGGMGMGMGGVVRGSAATGKGIGASATPQPTSALAREISNKLEAKFEGVNPAQLGLNELESWFLNELEIPLLLDPASLDLAEVDESVSIDIDVSNMPLRSALRKALQPLGLKAVVEDEGLTVTADHRELARRGIQTERWLDITPEVEKRFEESMSQRVSGRFHQIPLDEAIVQLSEQVSFPIAIDRRSLEELGLTSDVPVTATFDDISFRSALKLLLRELDLTYTLQGETLLITSIEAAEQNLRARIYWLEGTGIPRGEFNEIVGAIETSIASDTWESLGGPSTVTWLQSGQGNRPSLLINTTDKVHEQIQSLLDVMRQSHTGPDPISTAPSRPTTSGMGGMGGGMGGMGGGMGGGGMF